MGIPSNIEGMPFFWFEFLSLQFAISVTFYDAISSWWFRKKSEIPKNVIPALLIDSLFIGINKNDELVKTNADG